LPPEKRRGEGPPDSFYTTSWFGRKNGTENKKGKKNSRIYPAVWGGGGKKKKKNFLTGSFGKNGKMRRAKAGKRLVPKKAHETDLNLYYSKGRYSRI